MQRERGCYSAGENLADTKGGGDDKLGGGGAKRKRMLS